MMPYGDPHLDQATGRFWARLACVFGLTFLALVIYAGA